jgi:two-component system, cell cycle response regulator
MTDPTPQNDAPTRCCGAPQRVVAIDDSEFTHKLLAVQCARESYSLTSYLDPVEALEAVVADPPDLVLLDLDMPVLSGEDVCRKLKDTPQTSMVPVIFLTGNEELATKVRCFDLGAVDYIMKPFQGPELLARARAALRTKRLQDMLATRAQLDGLTGLWNRAHFDVVLRQYVDDYRRYGHRFALVMTDIDHFKRCNDAYGHPFGDCVIQRVAEVLATMARGSDVVCRYGGEEFAILLRETDEDGAGGFAERARQHVEALEFRAAGQTVKVTSSFGTAHVGDGRLDAHPDVGAALVEAADSALYAAKQAGRNRVAAAA